MTFLEKAVENEKEQGIPINVGSIIRENCPYEYGFEAEFKCNKVGEDSCFECWNREIPDTDKPFTKEEVERESAYNKGLLDGYNLVAKINDYTYEQLTDIFGMCSLRYILQSFTPQEAIAKLKEYEYAQKLKVGDVIKLPFGIGVVTSIDGEDVVFMTKSGEFGRLEGSVPKTGKHIDIKAILDQIGE